MNKLTTSVLVAIVLHFRSPSFVGLSATVLIVMLLSRLHGQ
jgi:hypothetical protein